MSEERYCGEDGGGLKVFTALKCLGGIRQESDFNHMYSR